MISPDADSLKQALANQLRRLKTKNEKLEALSNRISALRFFDFLLAFALIFLAARTGSTPLFLLILGLGVLSFMGLVAWHRRIDEASTRFRHWMDIRSQHLARMDLDWEQIPAPPARPAADNHPFARDFDITGPHSLLHLLDTTTYPGSRRYLEQWLTTTRPVRADIERRQQLVRELKPMAHFRDRLRLSARQARSRHGDTDWEMEDLLFWLRSTQRRNFGRPLAILGTLAVLNIGLLIGYLSGLIGPYVIFTFLAYLLIYNFYGSRVSGLFDEASQINSLLTQFRPVLQFLERYPYRESSRLGRFCKVFHQADQRPSTYLKKIIRLSSAASSQGSELTWLVMNALVPWDLYFARRLDQFKGELEPRLSEWLDRFYRLEALSGLANFGWLHPGYTFALPRKDRRTPVIEAKTLGHPLIPARRRVTNDVTIRAVGDVLLVTGSNMAGKSTFLRTLGINLCLCFAGGPVNATAFDTILFRLFSSINVTDSLDEGLSHFYAEVKRLRAMLDELNKPDTLPLLFMVDEIYRGTNNRERLAGSTAFLKEVAGKDGVGLVSTHDLELARLEQDIPSLSNWHFEETIEDGKMRFEYKLKPGPCPSTNALKIMQMEGLPVE